MQHFESSDKIEKDDDTSRIKLRSSSLAAPILEAVQEAQPFEEATFSNLQKIHPLTENSTCNGYVIYDKDGNLKSMKDTFGRNIKHLIFQILQEQEMKGHWIQYVDLNTP